MPIGYLFWGIYIFCVIAGIWGYYEPNSPWFRRAGGWFVLWILVGILGYKLFGSAVK